MSHRWSELFCDVPAPPECGSAAFPLPDVLREALAAHIENLGFELPGGLKMSREQATTPDGVVVPGAMGSWIRHSDTGGGVT